MRENSPDVLGGLARENHLSGLEAAALAERAGYYLGEISAAHPFREGNGRAQREFLRQLCGRAGFRIDWSAITREEMVAAARESFRTGGS